MIPSGSLIVEPDPALVHIRANIVLFGQFPQNNFTSAIIYNALATVASRSLVAVFSPPTPASRMHGTGLFLAGAGVSVGLLYYGRAFWITLLISVILAFLLEPFVAIVVRLRVPRGGAAFIICTIALLVLYLVGFAIVSQAGNIAEDLPAYSERVNKIVDRAADRMQTDGRDHLQTDRSEAVPGYASPTGTAGAAEEDQKTNGSTAFSASAYRAGGADQTGAQLVPEQHLRLHQLSL